MNYKAISLLVFGIGIIALPQYVRQYKVFEWRQVKSRSFIITQRLTGVLFIIIAILMIILNIE